MNIHELNTKTPAGTDYLAFDDGTDTYKAQAQNILSGADLAENNVTFTTDDTSGYPTGRKTMSPLFSSGTLSNLMAYISTAISNLRYALNRLEWQADRIGTGSISSVANSILEAIGDTSIGGVSLSRAISNILDKIGNTAMGTTATTITGAIAEHESDISTLNSKILSGTISANGQLSFTLTNFAVFIGFYSSGQNAIFGFRNGAAAEIVKNGSVLTATVTGNNVTISSTSSGGIRYFLLNN